MSSRFERRPSRPPRGGDPGGGRPSRGGPRGSSARMDDRGPGRDRRDRRDGSNERGESPWRGERSGDTKRRVPARGGSSDYVRSVSRAGVRSVDVAGRGRRDQRGSERRFSERNRDVPLRSRDGDARGSRSQDSRSLRSDRQDRRFDEKPRGEAKSHSADSVADDLLWGRHATQAALEAGRPIHRIWCTSEMRSAPRFMQLLRDAKASGVLVEEVTWARLAQMTGGAVHQGIALQTAAAETLDLSDLIEGCAALQEAPLLLALDGLTDPHNLGAIVRSAEALGAHGVVLPQRRSAGLTGSVAKVAAGALEHLPVARVVNLNRSLETLKDAGYRVVGLAEEGDQTLEEVDLDGPLVVVTGSEDQGLSMLTRRHCDHLIRIPLRGITPSLNASVATALCLYEVARRGWMKGLRGQNPSPQIVRPRLPAAPKTRSVVMPQETVLDLQLERSSEIPTPSFDGSVEL